jgi:hypothetical protein
VFCPASIVSDPNTGSTHLSSSLSGKMHAGMRMQMQNSNFALDMQLSLTATAHEYVDKCAVNSLNEFAQIYKFF